MQNLFYQISQVLGITIIHSLWQALIVFAALRLLLLVAPKLSAAAKHNTAFAALTLILAWFAYTLFIEIDSYNWAGTNATILLNAENLLPLNLSLFTTPADRAYFAISGYMPYITAVYLAGLVFNLSKLGLAWFNIRRIRQYALVSGYQEIINEISRRLNIRKTVAVAFSKLIDVPCITGFTKPLILLPLGISTYLSANEIEAILIHELAHVKRNDYLLNLIQQVIGVILFFNPFSRLINTTINAERENCCDDIVIPAALPLLYAQTLLKIELHRTQSWQLALAATGKKYQLLNRIQRIMKTNNPTINLRPALITLLALTCAISSIAWLNPRIKSGKINIKKITAVAKIAKALRPAIPVAIYQPKLIVKTSATKSNPDGLTSGISESKKIVVDSLSKNGKYSIVIIEQDRNSQKTYNSLAEVPAEDQKDVAEKFTYSVHYYKSDSSVHLVFIPKSEDQKKVKEVASAFGPSAQVLLFEAPHTEKGALAHVGTKMYYEPENKSQMEKLVKQFNTTKWRQVMYDDEKRRADPDFLNKERLFMKSSLDPDYKKLNKELNAAKKELQMLKDSLAATK